MREFFFVLESPFRRGLVPDNRYDSSLQDYGTRASAPYLSKAQNVRVGETGLTAINHPTSLMSVEWAYGALFHGTTVGQGDETQAACYGVHISSTDLSIFQVLSESEPTIYTTPYIVSPFDYPYMKMVGRQGVIVFIIGDSVVAFPNPEDSSYVVHDFTVVEDLCLFNERMVLAGFHEDWTSPYDDLIDTLIEQQRLSGSAGSAVPARGDYNKLILIGGLYGANERYPYASEISLLTGYESDTYHQDLVDRIRGGSMMLLHADLVGPIIRVEQFLSRLVVFGESGVSQFMHTEDGNYIERPLSGVPPINKHAVISTVGGVLYVGSDGNVYTMDNEHSVQKLGFKDWIALMDTDLIRLSYDSMDNDFYLSDGTYTLLFSKSGVTCSDICPMGFCVVDGEKRGLFTGSDSGEFYVETNRINMRRRSMNHLKAVSLSIEGGDNLRLVGLANYERSGEFTDICDIPVNKHGFTFPRVSGLDIKFAIKGDTTEDLNIGWAECRWRVHDKRTVRGLTEQFGGAEDVQQE